MESEIPENTVEFSSTISKKKKKRARKSNSSSELKKNDKKEKKQTGLKDYEHGCPLVPLISARIIWIIAQ